MSAIPMSNLPMLTIPKMPLTLFNSHLMGLDLPSDVFYQIHALSSRHQPPSRPGHPPKPLFITQSQQSDAQTALKL